MSQDPSNSPIAHLAALAARTPCPSCGRRRLESVLRCDFDTGPCLYTARWDGWSTTYELAMLDRERLGEGPHGLIGCLQRDHRDRRDAQPGGRPDRLAG